MSFLNKILAPFVKTRNKRVVFTYIMGDYDELKEPKVVSPGWDYLCLTDTPGLRSSVWQIIPLSPRDFEPYEHEPLKKRVKLIRMLYWQFLPSHYEVSLSIDANITINIDLNELIPAYFDPATHDLALCVHPDRDCIYQESEACKRYRKDQPEILDAHVARYRQEGYPEHNGLYATTFMLRRHDSQALSTLGPLWAEELSKGSQRDQMSLNYVLWKMKEKPLIQGLDWDGWLGREEGRPFVLGGHK
jgi:hypothetical protein